VYITGDTHAADFPATAGAFQTTCDPTQLPTWCNQGSYVAKLNPTGGEVVWATYLGNGSNAPIYFLGPVILNSAGDIYVLGEGNGKLPLGGGEVSSLNGPNTVYVAKFNSTGSQVLFGATVGGPGNGTEKAGGMAVDVSGAIYVGGAIGSGGSFSTPGVFQQAYAGGNADACFYFDRGPANHAHRQGRRALGKHHRSYRNRDLSERDHHPGHRHA
jgi:hypothetical protein